MMTLHRLLLIIWIKISLKKNCIILYGIKTTIFIFYIFYCTKKCDVLILGIELFIYVFPKKEWFHYDATFTDDEDDWHGNLGNYSICFNQYVNWPLWL